MKLILFGTAACHLCEMAQELLIPLLKNYPHIQLEQVDIAQQSQWQERYAIRIPVLLQPESQQELGWPFEKTAVLKFINELKITQCPADSTNHATYD
jgi:hypothetical protein